jgi:monoterpene epsilon-lactone hydrolase
MPSIQSQLMNFTMRNRHLLKFQFKREIWDWNTSIPQFRAECEAGALKAGKLPEGVTVTPVTIDSLPDGLRAEWIRPASSDADNQNDNGVIFYVHGGGYVSGSCSDHRHFVAKIVQGSAVPALLFEYRLAPEYPYPAALEDTLAAYRWLLDQGVSNSQVVFVGESAGGGLELAVLLASRDQGMPLPAAVVAMSPWTDLALTGESHKTRAKVCLSPPGMNMVCSRYYAGDNDPCLPAISPLYGDLQGLPPLCIYVGDHETLRDDSTRFAAKAQAAGGEVILKVEPGMVHCYPLFAPLFPEATQALNEICAYVQAQLERTKITV